MPFIPGIVGGTIYTNEGFTMSTIFHIDVNSAFLSWTSVHNLETGEGPDLRLVPSIIGGDASKRHGIVLAKSIPAKKYKIQTAEPIASALRKCPNLQVASPDFSIYKRYSNALMDHLRDFCPEIEQVSIDECYMNFTPVAHMYESALQAAYIIKDSVFERFGFTVNVGISDKKVLAKMASDFEKPNKVHTLYSHEIQEKMWPLPIGELFLCGKSSVTTLHKLGIMTIGQLAGSDPEMIYDNLKSIGTTLYQFANGIDDSVVNLTHEREKSVGNSVTVSSDITERESAIKTLLALADSVSSRLRKAHLRALNVCVEIKYSDFRKTSKQMALRGPSDDSPTLYSHALLLFDKLWNGDPIRLLGLRTGKLEDASEPVQMSLFDLPQFNSGAGNSQSSDSGALSVSVNHDTTKQSSGEEYLGPGRQEKQHRLDEALDSIRSKYGKEAIMRGTLYKPDGSAPSKPQ